MKKLLILLLLCIPLTVCADDVDDMINAQIEKSGIGTLSEQLDKVKNHDFDEMIPDFDLTRMTKSLTKGGWSWDISVLIKRAFAFYCKELYLSLKILITLIALALACSLADNLQKSFCEGGLGEAAFFFGFFLTAAVAVKAFIACISAAAGVIDDMVVFISALVPMTLTLLAASGGVVSAGIFHPVLMLSVTAVPVIVKTVIMPLILLSAALSIADCVSGKSTVSRLAGLFKSVAKWTMGVMLTVFVGVVTIQSLAAPAIDGISVKTAKFAVGSLVPVVGSVLSETVDLVFGCSLILKNAVGITGLLVLLGICSVPLIRLIAQATMFAVAAALTEPIADKRISEMLSKLGEAVMLTFVAVTVTAVMVVIELAIVIGAGNSAALLGR